MSTTLNVKEITARKPHRCDYCNGEIKKGEIYQTSTIIEDGIYRWKSHIHCKEIAKHMFADDNYCFYQEGISNEDFVEYISEYYYEKNIKIDYKDVHIYTLRYFKDDISTKYQGGAKKNGWFPCSCMEISKSCQ